MAGNVVASLRWNQKTCSSHALTWSEDSRIAVATEGGVYVVDLSCGLDASDSLVARQAFISASPDVCEFNVDVDREKCYNSLPADELNPIMLDRTVSPGIGSGQPYSYRGCRTVRWSAKGVDPMGRCILATLSMDHRLCIYNMGGFHLKWKKVVDLSNSYYQHMKTKKFTMDDESQPKGKQNQTSLLTQRSYLLAAVAIDWSPVYTAQVSLEPVAAKCAKFSGPEPMSYCFLATAMKSGHIVLWKINIPCSTEDDISLHEVVYTGSMLPVCIKWASYLDDTGLLCVGYRSGILKAHVVSHTTDQLALTKAGFVHLWDQEDKLGVTAIEWMKEERLLVASKASFLVFIDICMASSGIEIKKTKTFIGRNNLIISGLSTFPSGVIIGSQDGIIQTVQISKTQSGDIEVVSESVLDMPKQYKVVNCCGASVSKDRVFLAHLQSPRYYVEARDEDSKLILQLYISVHTPVEQTLAALLEGKLESAHSTHNALASVAFAPGKKANQGQQILECLMLADKNLQGLIVQNLQRLRSLGVIFLKHYQGILKNISSQTMEDIQKICDTIEERILKLHCTDWLYRIGDEAGELDDMWKISACIMCQILRSGKTEVDCKKRDTLIENVKSKLQFHKPAEKCNICGEVINFSSAKQDSCGNGHKFARCCQSLLLVQETPYRKCQNCRALAIALPVTAPECIKKMLVSTCTFCAGVVV